MLKAADKGRRALPRRQPPKRVAFADDVLVDGTSSDAGYGTSSADTVVPSLRPDAAASAAAAPAKPLTLHSEGGIMDGPEEAGEAGCGSAARSLASGVPGPIFFLIKEQAKSLLAIKELQDRVQALEGFRNDIFFAIQDIQQTMQSSPERPPQVVLTASKEPAKAASVHRIDSRAPLGGSESKSWTLNPKPRRHKEGPLMTAVCGRARARSAAVGGELSQGVVAKPVASLSSKGDTASAILESDKQDSGLDSDCRDHGSRESTLAPKDELLALLDIIDERSVQLQERLREMEKSKNLDTMLRGGASSRSEVLEFHEKELQTRLSEMEVERTKHRMQVRQLQATIHRMEGERIACEEKLQASLCERKELEKKVHSLHMQYVRAGPSSLPLAKSDADPWPVTSLQGAQKLVSDVAKGITTEEGKAKVSNILKESSLLELKRLLLLYTLENQALKEKAEESDQHWFSKLSEWKATEASLRSDIQALIQEKEECLERFRRHRRDMEIMQAKYKELEMTVWALDNVEHQRDYRRDEGMLPVGTRFLRPADQRLPRPCQNISYGDTGCKTQSLPPMLLNQVRNSPLLPRRGAYATEFRRNSLAENSLEEVGFSNEGMAYELVDPRHHKATVFAEQPQKTFSPYWQDRRVGAAVMPSDAVRLMNLEDDHEEELKSGPQSNIEMICNEFDPLSENGRQCANKPLDFEDSLDLSIPLKPTRNPASNTPRSSRSTLNMNYLSPASSSPKVTLDQKHRTFGKTQN
ncbi:uncharacterized protein LOC119396750 isoform X2 [Rhipicephalus sanguineus]|uniref:uncharacterized protein LOC119396750 isoform X2 n=1 Tax=Rhipicephalus sanguineus TaxID=34632 RepID=UPI001893A866|nr:uncharacterized protein LOC119396750 isoform X2 [Rhipicephalus sanguineus]